MCLLSYITCLSYLGLVTQLCIRNVIHYKYIVYYITSWKCKLRLFMFDNTAWWNWAVSLRKAQKLPLPWAQETDSYYLGKHQVCFSVC